MGYHKRKIERGVLGTLSKIREELEETEEAAEQGAKLLVLCELADLIGALKLYLAAEHPSICLADLEQMAALTASAFKEGSR